MKVRWWSNHTLDIGRTGLRQLDPLGNKVTVAEGCLESHGPGFLSRNLQTQLAVLVTDEVKCLLGLGDLVAATREDQGQVVAVAEKCLALAEEQADQLLHQEGKKSWAEDPALGRAAPCSSITAHGT